MTKILVTGANGFLAINTILELLQNGYYVRGLLRNKDNFHLAPHPHLALVEGNVTNQEDVENAVKGCDYVIHAAAVTDPGHFYYNDYAHVNVDGTKIILNACIKYQIKRLIFISTANVFGYGEKDYPGDESKKIRNPFAKSFYTLTKQRAQNIILEAADKIETVVVSPSLLIGPYDTKPSSGKIVLWGLDKPVIFYPPGGKNLIHVMDAAKGVVRALTFGKAGEAYLLANANLTYREFFKMLATKSGKKPFLIKLPKWFLTLLGISGDLLRYWGLKTQISLINTQVLCINSFYSNNKAKKDLSFTTTPIEEAIDSSIAWFRYKIRNDKNIKINSPEIQFKEKKDSNTSFKSQFE